jgi:hypothetical protein
MSVSDRRADHVKVSTVLAVVDPQDTGRPLIPPLTNTV